jgi:hypothetical protein
MSQDPSIYRRPPRGRPLIGFQVEVPREVELREGPTLRCREVLQGGRTLGEIEISLFAAALVIDRDGLLAEKACEVMAHEATVRGGPIAVAVALPGASGFRAEAVTNTPLPYRYVFAIAPPDLGVDGGIAITIRCASPDWPAADHMLRSLRILTRNGRIATQLEVDDGPLLPVVAPLSKRD